MRLHGLFFGTVLRDDSVLRYFDFGGARLRFKWGFLPCSWGIRGFFRKNQQSPLPTAEKYDIIISSPIPPKGRQLNEQNLNRNSKLFSQMQIATLPGQQGRNSRSSKDIIPGQRKQVKKRNNITSPAVFHRQERREAQASACGKLPAVTKAAPQCGLS